MIRTMTEAQDALITQLMYKLVRVVNGEPNSDPRATIPIIHAEMLAVVLLGEKGYTGTDSKLIASIADQILYSSRNTLIPKELADGRHRRS